MKAMDLLKYLDKADPAYIEEASDFSLLLYRKGRKRTRTAEQVERVCIANIRTDDIKNIFLHSVRCRSYTVALKADKL